MELQPCNRTAYATARRTGVRKVRLERAVRLPLEEASQKKMP